jgi:hypothetical protein
VYFSRPNRYITGVPCIGWNNPANPSIYAPSFALSRYSCGYYGVGHTAWRQPGDMRGTVVGKQGRFKLFPSREEVMFKA